MSDSKSEELVAFHTPGPWVVDYGYTSGHIKSVAPREDKGTPTVCRYDMCADTVSHQAAANAALIAAAPELMSALEMVWNSIDRVNHPAAKAVREALFKARGLV